MPNRNLSDGPVGPVRSWFPKGENLLVGVHTFNVIGSGILGTRTTPPTGLPTGVNSAGVPDVTATFIATGIYDVRFPATRAVDIFAQVSAPSGYMYQAQANEQNPNGFGATYVPTGGGRTSLQITRLSGPGGSGTGFTLGQGAAQGAGYLPSGAKVMLQFWAAPTTDGLTAY